MVCEKAAAPVKKKNAISNRRRFPQKVNSSAFCTVARNGNEALCLAADGIRLGARGADTLMDKELFDKVATECVACTTRPSQSIT